MESPEVLYQTHQSLLADIVWKFIWRTEKSPTEFEEFFSQANEYFMIAYNTFDENKSEFSTWLYAQVQGRLLRYNQKEKERPERHFPKSFSYIDFVEILDEISIDGINLINLYRTGRMDLEQIYKGKHNKSGITPVFRFLKQQGWTRQQIRNSFNDIKRLFN